MKYHRKALTMPNIGKGLLARIRSIIGAKPKVPPKPRSIGMGHRGIAAGNIKERHRKIEAGEQPYTAEEVGKWQTLPESEVEAFLEGEYTTVHSSNVLAAQYHAQDRKMMVEFHGGQAYMVSPISEQEAIEFMRAPSKGGYYWSNIRVRGPGNARKSKKHVVRIK